VSSAAKPRTAPRRVTLDEAPEKNDFAAVSSRSRQTLDSHLSIHHDDKENISEPDENLSHIPSSKRRHSPPLASRSSTRPALRTTYTSTGSGRQALDVPQRASHARQPVSMPNRAGRMVKSISTSSTSSKHSSSALDRYHDTDVSENEYGPSPTSAPTNYGDRNSAAWPAPNDIDIDVGGDAEAHPENIPIPSSGNSNGRQRNLAVGSVAAASSMYQSSSNRPRRSASLSDALRMFPVPLDSQ
jgi:serine/threonine-protein kinase TTK/MPS1